MTLCWLSSPLFCLVLDTELFFSGSIQCYNVSSKVSCWKSVMAEHVFQSNIHGFSWDSTRANLSFSIFCKWVILLLKLLKCWPFNLNGFVSFFFSCTTHLLIKTIFHCNRMVLGAYLYKSPVMSYTSTSKWKIKYTLHYITYECFSLDYKTEPYQWKCQWCASVVLGTSGASWELPENCFWTKGCFIPSSCSITDALRGW